MTEEQPDNMIAEDLCGIANLHRFRHAAMAASFDVFIVHSDAVYAGQAARAAFEELDRIENNLSRFIENSDVSRINSLGKSHPLQIGLETFECLRLSIEMCKQTKGAFDITFGSLHTGSKLMKLNKAHHTIELSADGVRLDLGAIGKGYAADKMGQLLCDWGINTALISAGQSTVLPIGTPPRLLVEDKSGGWPVTLSDPVDYHLLARVNLAGCALSASGMHKGQHIIDPRSGKPAKGKLAAWATAKTAACADALSTAFMVMSVDEVRAFCKANRDTSALLVLSGRKKELVRFGRWQNTAFY
jgi:thiamine biosynthesis lipoprotein